MLASLDRPIPPDRISSADPGAHRSPRAREALPVGPYRGRGSDVDAGDDGAVVRACYVLPSARVVVDRGSGAGSVGSHLAVDHVLHQGVADQDVIDQLAAAAVAAAEPLLCGDACGQVPQPLAIAP